MLTIVHLSDLHIKENNSEFISFADPISRAVATQISQGDTVVLLVTGDIAFSGKSTEYSIAEKFIKKLTSISELKRCYILTCPGNHDNDHSGDVSVRESVLKDIKDKTPSEQHINVCVSVQKEYNKFRKMIESDCYSSTNLNTVFEIEDSGKFFAINAINTAYCCKKDCSLGDIFVPDEIFDIDVMQPEYKIAVMHHTPNWFTSEDQRRLRSTLNKNYDLVFSGHEHELGQYAMNVKGNMNTEFVEGGQLSDVAHNLPPSFNVVKIDSANNLIKLAEFIYDRKEKIFRQQGSSDWKELVNTKYCRCYGDLNDDFIHFLDEAGANYFHPNKEHVKLQDIYVFPNLKGSTFANMHKRSRNEQHLNAKKIIQKDFGQIAIAGSDKAGKTSLAKVIFSEVNSFSLIPIYIDCQDITASSYKDINKLVFTRYAEQYKNLDIDVFDQSKKKVALPILDNFHLSKIKNYERVNILRQFILAYENLLVFVDDVFLIEDLANNEEKQTAHSDKLIKKLSTYTIISFGYALRGELVKKWLNISDNGIDIDDEQTRQYDNYVKKLDQLVEYNYVPPFPIYLLTTLSTANIQPTGDIVASSYGHYYTALVTMSLAKVDIRHEEVDLRISFLGELAFFLYETKNISLTTSEFTDFVSSIFEKTYDITLDSSFKNTLISANILREKDGCITFKYKYYFYYFVASYISKNIYENDKARDATIRLIQSIYKEASSCILMFLINFSKDSFIIDKIVSYAKSLFENSPKATIGDDTSHFNELFSEIQRAIIPDVRQSEARRKAETEKDKINPRCDDDYYGENIEIDEKEPDGKEEEFIAVLTAAIKCVTLIGQMLKSHYGSLKADQKEPLLSEGINISMRALGDFYEYMKDNKSFLIKEIGEMIKTSKIEGSFDVESISKRLVMNASSALSLNFVMLPANAFGTKNLRKTYENYFSCNNQDNANKLLKFAIELESSHKIDINSVKKLVVDFSSNVMALTVLQKLVMHHLYMYDTDFRIKQQVAELLKISTKNQVVLGEYSKEKQLRQR